MGHEDYGRAEGVEGSSDRAFGLVFAAVFAVVCIWPLLSHDRPRWWALAFAGLFAAAALFKPGLLQGLNRAWTRFGLLLARVVNPLVLGLMFFLAFVPIAWVLRMRGKDPLRLKFDPTASTYWIAREPPGPPAGSMTNQY